MAEFPDLSKVEIDGNEEFRKPGLAKRDFIRLKQGKFHRQDSAYVRGYTVEESAKIVRRFLADSVNSGFRCVKIVHGKGLNSPDGISRVKLTTQKILTLNKFVLGYCNALPNDGGSGGEVHSAEKKTGLNSSVSLPSVLNDWPVRMSLTLQPKQRCLLSDR